MRSALSPALPTLPEIERFVDTLLGVTHRGEEPSGILRPRDGTVERIGLALDPHPGLGAWTLADRLDALFLHRAWRLVPHGLPASVGVITYHAPFDQRLTCGFNPRLAAALGMRDIQPFGERDGRAIGMRGEVEPQRFAEFAQRAADQFGGLEAVSLPARDAVRRVVVVGAMTGDLVREAGEADVYLTGQLRVPAREAVAVTGIGVIAAGHLRSEQWGLGALASALQEAWPALATVVRPLE